MLNPNVSCATLAAALARLALDEPPIAEFLQHVCDAFADCLQASAFAVVLYDGEQTVVEFNRGFADARAALDAFESLQSSGENRVLAEPLAEDAETTDIAVPLPSKGGTMGVVLARMPSGVAEKADHATLQTATLNMAAYIARAKRDAESIGFRDLALADPLTGVANRRFFDLGLHEEWARATRGTYPLAVIFIDVDFFGLYNTRYGHPAGDACLRKIAAALQLCVVRETDVIARYGGEEFVAVLPATDLQGAIVVAERMRSAIEALSLAHESTSLRRVSISLGAAAIIPAATDSSQGLIDAADACMLRAKERGRNRLVCSGHESTAPPAARRYESSHNLPNDITRFVGREYELQHIAALISENRLVVLCGPAGVGKTRIACEAARRSADLFADGATFIDLSSIPHAEGVLSTIAAGLGIGDESGKPLMQTIVERLQSREQLVLLDNCEHVVDTVGEIVERLLTQCANLRVLATTRQSLEVAGETLFSIQPFSAADAKAFFTERVQAASAASALAANDLQAIGSICERLDRLPFALELVAPRVSALGISGILELLEDTSFVLSTSLHRSRQRQQTVENLLEWSYRLLTAGEQQVLRRLAVLGRRWTEQTALAVCGDGFTGETLQAAIAELVRKSLLVHDVDTQRYNLLELTRQFGAARLRESGEEAMVRARLAKEMLAQSAGLYEHAHSGRFKMARRAMSKCWPNFVVALQHTLAEGDDPNTGAQIAANLAFYCVSTARAEVTTYWLNLAAAHEDELSAPVLAEVLLARALLAQSALDHEAVHRYASSAAIIFQDANNFSRLAIAQGLCATADLSMGNYAQAQALNEASLRNAETAGDRPSIASALFNAGIVAAEWQADFATACKVYDDAIGILQSMDAPASLARVLLKLAEARFAQGAVDEVLRLADRALVTLERVGDAFAGYAASLGASFYIALGRAEPARRLLRTALDTYQQFPGSRWIVHCFEQCGRLAFMNGDLATAAHLNGLVDAHCQEAEFDFSARTEAAVLAFRCEVRDRLAMDDYASYYRQGSAWSIPQGIEAARRVVIQSTLAA